MSHKRDWMRDNGCPHPFHVDNGSVRGTLLERPSQRMDAVVAALRSMLQHITVLNAQEYIHHWTKTKQLLVPIKIKKIGDAWNEGTRIVMDHKIISIIEPLALPFYNKQ